MSKSSGGGEYEAAEKFDLRPYSEEESGNPVAQVLPADEEPQSRNQELPSPNAALAEARDLASWILKTGDRPLLVLDSQLRIVSANPSFYRAFEISSQQAEGQYLYSVSNGSWNIPRLRELLERLLPNQKVVHGFEIEWNFPGIGHKLLVLAARQLDTLQQIVVDIEDATAHLGHAHAALRESEERFRSMADSGPVLIWQTGPDKASTFFNKPWLDFTGRTLQQELGDWVESVHPEDLDRCVRTCLSAFEVRRSFQMEFRLRRSDGEYRWMLDSGMPRFEDNGAFAGYVGSCIDITDSKATREADFAKQNLETVGLLAGGIAHDFNNLLGGILANSELALEELGSRTSGTEALRKIRIASIRGAEIVRQLMIFSGQEIEVPELLEVGSLVADMVELLQVSVSKHVKVETHFGKNLPLVRASRAQIQQIAMNLITNASEAMGELDGVIRVATTRVTIAHDWPQEASEHLAEGEYLQLEVADTGPGMTPEIQTRVFDLFFTTKLPGSHGRGLSVVQRIVQNLRGTISILSAPGMGATFRILLPAEDHPVDAARVTDSQTGEESFLSRKVTIFVVEDEDLLRQATSTMLRRKGLVVVEASNGSSALNVIREQTDQIDILLLDMTLPGAPSRDVYEEARRRRPEMAVIVTSAKTREMAAASLSTNIEHFLRKPFRLEDLLRMIRVAVPDGN